MSNIKYYANLNPFTVTLPNIRGGQRMINPNEVVHGDWWSRLCGNRQLTEIDPENYRIVGRKITDGLNIRNKGGKSPVNESRLIDDPKITGRRIRASKVATLADDVCQSGCEAGCEGQCELVVQGIQEFDHMRGVADVFFCKYCEYNSSIQKDVESHLERDHKDMLHPNERGPEGDVVKDTPKEVVDAIRSIPAMKDAKLKAVVMDDLEDNDRFSDIEKVRSDVDDFGEEPKEVVEDEEVVETEELIQVKEDADEYRVYEDGTYECKECGKRYKSLSWIAKHINGSHR